MNTLQSFLQCLLWTTNDSNCEPLDSNYDTTDFSTTALTKIKADLETFLATDAVKELPPGHDIGHDFCLTANGHGVGFWDRGLGELGDRVTEECHNFRFDCYVGDDGKLHI